MKSVIYTAVAVACLATNSVHGYETYLKQIPNGSKFAKALGHGGDGYTAFATAFLEAGTTWTPAFCKLTFPGSKLSMGQAFGDPCCVWKTGAAAPQSVNAFTTNPGAGTTCASDAKPSTAPSTAPTKAPSAPSSAPAPAPAPGGNATKKPTNTPKPATTPKKNCKTKKYRN